MEWLVASAVFVGLVALLPQSLKNSHASTRKGNSGSS